MKAVLATGGTGGHIFPALAVAEELRRRDPSGDVLFVGSRSGREAELARQAGIPFHGLPARGVMGRGFKAAASLMLISISIVRAFFLLRRYRPDVVLGLGGYAGFAPVIAAKRLGIPTALHEQNSIPGLTNRVLGRRVDRVFLTLPDIHGHFEAARSVITGNPIRVSLLDAARERAAGERPVGKNILVFGGSQGARAINDLILGSLAQLKAQGFALWHQTGEADHQRVSEAYVREGMETDRVQVFIKDMGAAYNWCDLVICRAGASTLAELTAMGLPSILIPYPYATHDHQLHNAQHMERAEAALLLVQSCLGDIRLTRLLDDLFSTPNRLREMGRAARTLGRPDAASRIVDELLASARVKERR